MKLLKLSLLNLLFWSADMATAIVGMVYGFGLTVQSWPALIGFMLFSRWAVYVVRGCYAVHSKRVEP
jgi:hypothetical protein